MCVFPPETIAQVEHNREVGALAHYNGKEIIPDSAKLILPGDANSHDSHEAPIVSPDADNLMRYVKRVPQGVIGSFQALPIAV